MDNRGDLLLRIRHAAEKKCLFLPHALRQMIRPERMISTEEICRVIKHGEIIEDYPEDARGHSCLMPGCGKSGRQIHVVCACKEDYLAIITAYLPDEKEWAGDFKTRRAS